MTAMAAHDGITIRASDITVAFNGVSVLENLELDVRRAEVMGFVGPSGAGKSVLLRTIVGLNKRLSGRIEILGRDLDELDHRQRRELEARWGVLFQSGALFSSLTVAQNIEVPLFEHTKLPLDVVEEICALKIGLVGLPPEAASKYPMELSGGMRKRAGLARALALDPEILFLDEPTAGLDPIGARAFDELLRSLQESLGITVFMVTHDLGSLHAVCDRIAVLGDKHVIVIGTMAEMLAHEHPWIRDYFHGPRGRAARHRENG
ncbi:MAG: ABC transporter ATP-binding protein [Alphaproteobacteria bacterium]|jgi:phospholipid/cholesterol/gamma-HCH transport system ATP-binding protein|nr:ABC transporter ATP-binding protein [Alphaproteobacteria bacterium]MDP6818105.1 ABC transporter ATP-binding protein [Alphaproteobacteria bacterium]